MFGLIFMGMLYDDQIFKTILSFSKIKLLGCILDYNNTEEEIKKANTFLHDNKIKEIKLSEIPNYNPDLIFICNYTTIIKSDLLDKYLFINIHAGILPKWRGFNANCWAIINGENEVGYSIHRARCEFDAGEIFKIISVSLNEMETYSSARNRIKTLLCEQLESIFLGIIDGSIKPKEQDNKNIVYTCRLKKTDGYIYDWNKETKQILRFYRVFKDGTGTVMFIKNIPYVINEMEIVPSFPIVTGIPGSVVNILSDKSVYIKTKDTVIKVNKLVDDNNVEILPGDLLKIGMRL